MTELGFDSAQVKILPRAFYLKWFNAKYFKAFKEIFGLVIVLSGKHNWSIFGSVFEAIFTDKTFQLLYKDEGEGKATLTLTEIRGPNAGNILLLPAKIVELRPKLFMVTWQEPNKETVTEIEDYENGFLYANITSPKDKFFTLRAELKEIS